MNGFGKTPWKCSIQRGEERDCCVCVGSSSSFPCFSSFPVNFSCVLVQLTKDYTTNILESVWFCICAVCNVRWCTKACKFLLVVRFASITSVCFSPALFWILMQCRNNGDTDEMILAQFHGSTTAALSAYTMHCMDIFIDSCTLPSNISHDHSLWHTCASI